VAYYSSTRESLYVVVTLEVSLIHTKNREKHIFKMCLFFYKCFKEEQVTNTVNIRNKLPDNNNIKKKNNDKNKIHYIK